jgi:hypothetical protein
MRVRADKAQLDADRLRASADAALAHAENLFATARELGAVRTSQRSASLTLHASGDPETAPAPVQRSAQPGPTEAPSGAAVPLSS